MEIMGKRMFCMVYGQIQQNLTIIRSSSQHPNKTSNSLPNLKISSHSSSKDPHCPYFPTFPSSLDILYRPKLILIIKLKISNRWANYEPVPSKSPSSSNPTSMTIALNTISHPLRPPSSKCRRRIRLNCKPCRSRPYSQICRIDWIGWKRGLWARFAIFKERYR